jgi:hypothetical protein
VTTTKKGHFEKHPMQMVSTELQIRISRSFPK